jgi:PAS domain S-box-containing protein
MKTDLPMDEARRLDRLQRLQVLDTDAEPVLDGFTRLAASLTGRPIALLSLLDERRQWFKSAVGLPQGSELPRNQSICDTVILDDALFEVEDARLDPRFAQLPHVAGPPHLASYAGVPLRMPEGERVGTLCVMGPEPGLLSPLQREQLCEIASAAVHTLLLREKERDLRRERRLAANELLDDFAPVGLCWGDGCGAVEEANTEWHQLLGAPSFEAAAGQGWTGYIDPRDLAALHEDWLRAVAGRLPHEGLFRTRVPEGAPVRWVRFRGMFNERPDGRTGFVCALSDATESVQLQEQLERKNALLEAIIEHLPAGVTVFDSALRHVASNSAAREMLQLPASLFDGRSDFRDLARVLAERGDYGPGDPGELVEDRVRQVMAVPHQRERLLADGRRLEVRARGMADGSVVTTYTDVTRQREALARLRDSEQRLSRALEASMLGLWELDIPHHRVYYSGSWNALLGRPPHDVHGEPLNLLRFTPPEQLPALQAARRALLKGEIPRLSVEHEMLTTPGRTIWLLTEASVTERGPDGRALKVVGTCRDITERRQARAALEQALHAAGEANRAKSEFLATMSHEIRTPINGVIGLTQLLSSAHLPERERGYVGMIDNCAKSLLSLVENVLDFSQIEARRVTLAEAPTDLRALVREICDVFSVRAAEKDIGFEVHVDHAVPASVLVDPDRLRQVLINLLGNACKFTSDGHFALHVGLGGHAPGRLCFTVSDTGIGISAEDQARLFTRFTQADGSSRRRFQGSGLGLAISRDLARLMGGEVHLASRAGEGSTFTLDLPLRLAVPAAPAAAPTSEHAGSDAPLLLVEDNEVNRLVAQGLLAGLGFTHVETASHGREAVLACERTAFVLVLMDCQMPEMDGFEATAALRAAGHRMPIVALTAHAIAGDRERCLEAGMDDYLAKPIEPRLLGEKLRKWLGGREPGAAPDYDPATPGDRFVGNLPLFARARALFLDGAPGDLQAIARSAQAGDAEAARRIAHRLKGSAGTVGAMQLAQLCGCIGGDGTLPSPAAWLARAEASLARYTVASVTPG